MIEISKIRIDGGTQSRLKLCESTVSEYAEYIDKMPAVTLFYDGADYWLADGFHRFFAAKKAGKKTIYETIIPGTKRDAILHSVGANAAHGLRRSNEDKRKSVQTLLNDPEWAAWSDNEISKVAAVTRPFVTKIRDSILQPLQDSHQINTDEPVKRTVKRNGKIYEMNITKIGKVADISKEIEESEEEYSETDQLVDNLQEQNEHMRDEIDRLNDLIAAAQSDDPEKSIKHIEELRNQIKTLSAELIAVKSGRDSYQRQNGEMKKQIAMMKKELKRLGGDA
jgi:FtsZ-binding cell division protein ZapB